MGDDPLLERKRLTELYAGLTDGELGKLLAEQEELTDMARDVLREEVRRRQSRPGHPGESSASFGELEDLPLEQQDEIAYRDLVPVRQFRDMPDALLAKGLLESAGIECFFGDENIVRLDWFISNLVGGVKLLVKPEDAEAAREILDQPVPPTFDVGDSSEYQQPSCPKCGSYNVSFEELNKKVAFATAYFGVPLPLKKKVWKCSACGAEWRDHPDEPETSGEPDI